jgi:DNA-binding transcriptional LysR family regulator
MNTIPIHLLNAFVVFNESANITEAATHLGITQPALSKQLKSLEEKCEHKLFTLMGRRKVLTPYGRDLHGQLKSRLSGLQELVEQSGLLHSDPRHAEIRLGARRGIIDRCCREIQFAGQVTFVEASNDQIIASLLKQEIEIGIVHSVPNSSELIVKPLFKEEFKIVIPKTLLKVKRNYGATLFQDLRSIPCIAFKKEDEVLQQLCLANSIDPASLKVSRITSSYASIAEMVQAKLGWAALPAYLEADPVKNWIIPIPKDLLKLREFYIAYRREFKDVSWFKDLTKEVTDCF